MTQVNYAEILGGPRDGEAVKISGPYLEEVIPVEYHEALTDFAPPPMAHFQTVRYTLRKRYFPDGHTKQYYILDSHLEGLGAK